MRENQQRWLALVRAKEGGFTNDPRDDGGATNMGVTQKTLAEWRGRPVTVEDVRALTWDEASSLYLARYWSRIRGDELPGGLDIALGDAVVTSRMAGQVKILQGILGVEQDGYVGPLTIAAARKADTAATIRAFFKARLAYLQTLDDWQHFGKGWTNRCEDVQAECLAQVQANVIEARAPKAAAGAAGYSILAVVLASLPQLWPEIAPHLTGARDAYAAQDWAGLSQSVCLALAVLVPAGIRFAVRYAAHRRAEA